MGLCCSARWWPKNNLRPCTRSRRVCDALLPTLRCYELLLSIEEIADARAPLPLGRRCRRVPARQHRRPVAHLRLPGQPAHHQRLPARPAARLALPAVRRQRGGQDDAAAGRPALQPLLMGTPPILLCRRLSACEPPLLSSNPLHATVCLNTGAGWEIHGEGGRCPRPGAAGIPRPGAHKQRRAELPGPPVAAGHRLCG